MSTKPRAQVREVDGQLVLDDPDAAAMAGAVAKHNCRQTLEAQRERVEYFKGRIAARGLTFADVVIVLLNCDDPVGGVLADLLMPHAGPMWDEMRSRGEVPYARGLASREGVSDFVAAYDPNAGVKLRDLNCTAVVVIDYGAIEVFPA